ncbi:glycosyltransferase [Rhodococcoides fascians]|uniref:4,4'-diaponeurosporenoate glycosyltransferase n=1 Tax=Rhodococcoides fascians TaxID=1828 RepID=A0A143QS74_RHOFA|nr:glycosyltransferase family 2 protein [Rhodococcus fascians]AMY25588.1 4,4'-diaponeurosporenoate glycosyltransferase [Rhodococcus fascians]KMJ49521.1 glycosyl transferase [Rhodococcus fascians]MBY4111281.1 glycosyltransferase [Rhodococcus fascians]MBY4116148.1 glycosyltransferase [Rhodococcus fascians]OZC40522.1 glycosyl transferase [Rhodococcus fascians]
MTVLTRATRATAVLASTSAAVAVFNALFVPGLRRPSRDVTERVAVCIPARNEVDTLPALIGDLTRQRFCIDLQVVVLDDDSTDGTAAAAVTAANGDPRFRVVTSHASPPPGWTGKAAACAELADSVDVDTTIVMFVDADVRLEPEAVAAAARRLRRRGDALMCPWPEQVAGGLAERLVQPLLAWSWMSTLPVPVGNATLLPSMAVACGQFMAFDAAAYRVVGGHSCVASSATEDLDIARVLRRRGFSTSVASGAGFVRCRMYRSAADVRAGYSRWLWNEFGGPVGSATAALALSTVYLLPPVAAVFGSGSTRRLGLVGYLAGTVSRVASRRRESGPRFGARDVVDAAVHPLSILAFVGLVAESHVRRRRGALSWKSRPMPTS